MQNGINKFYSIGSPIEKKELDLGCPINDQKAMLIIQPGILVDIDEKGNPSFVKTALRTRLPKYDVEQISFPEGCKNCLKTVQQNCAEILFNKINK